MNTENLIDTYIETSSNRINTQIAYRSRLQHLVDYLKGLDINILEVKVSTLKAFQLSLEGKSDATQFAIITAVKGLYKFLYEDDIIEKNVAKSLKAKSPQNINEKFLNRYEAKTLLVYLKDMVRTRGMKSFDFLKARDLFFFTLVLKYGFRVSEVIGDEKKDIIGLKKENFMFDKGLIFISGKNRKNKKDLKVPMDIEITEMYNNYMKFREELSISTDNIFVSYRGKKLTNSGVNTMIKERIKESNLYFKSYVEKYKDDDIVMIREDITVHNLRHTANYLMDINGYSATERASILGQSVEVNANRYSHSSENDIREKQFKLCDI